MTGPEKDEALISRFAPPLLALLLTACSASSATTAATGKDGPVDAPVDAVRVAMPADSPAPPATRAGVADGKWTATPDTARFGYAGEAPALSLECRKGSLVVTRNVAAPVGAAALFALQGSGYILRLPVDATAIPGQRGYVWQGAIAPNDKRLTLFKGKFAGTLPGGGHIEVPASEVPGTLIKRCAAREA
ncbi:hypothetical protein [Novosphingobium fuchskuhlense]|nr:hypothetical protein [Novosphingobium fuchskuhlense]